jgi:hypothetical protein
LQVIGPLVLGDFLEHDLETAKLVFERGGAAIFLLGLQILGGKIRGHGWLPG